MLKISKLAPADPRVTLRLEGSIAGPWVAEARTACERVLNEGWTLQLNLAEVDFVDARGIALLSDLRSKGVSVLECSPFVAAQLKAIPDQ
jgi:ABC-type transporter Mla MlaB component